LPCIGPSPPALTGKATGEKAMNSARDKTFLSLIGWTIISMAPFLSSCLHDTELAYINDQITKLNRNTASLQKAVDEDLNSINSNQAEIMLEIDQLKEDIRDLSGRVEDNEYIIKNIVEKDLSAQDEIRASLERVAVLERALKQQQEYLGLEPFDLEKERPEYQEDEEAAPEAGADQEATGKAIEEDDQESRAVEMYNESLSLFKEERYEQAMESFKAFLGDFPESELADNAQFWTAECLMALEQYKQAILAYQDVIKRYPEGNKVSNAMFRQAIAFLEIDDQPSAEIVLQKLIKQFPDSSEAETARTKLKTLK
jgi:tol-pal system protein YbgF